MDRQKVIEIARQKMAGRREIPTREIGHLFRHGLRVAQLAERIATVERDVVFAAGLFHDVGKGIEPHNEVGAALARLLLREVCDSEQLEQIVYVIAEHRRRDQPQAPPALRIVQDADILDHVGTHAIWMGCAFNAYKDLGPEGLLSFFASPENQRYQQGMRSALHFERSRNIFDRRLAQEQAFMDHFRQEMSGEF